MTGFIRATAATCTLGLSFLCGCGAAEAQAPEAKRAQAPPQAEELLGRIAEAYREVPALQDKLTLAVTGMGVNHSVDGQVTIGPGTDAQVTMEGFRITALGKDFFVERLDRPDKYVQTALQENLARSFQALAGTAVAVPQCMLRYGDDAGEHLAALGLGRLQQPRVTGAGRVEHRGQTLDELRVQDNNGGSATALVEPKTGFLVALDVRAGGLSFAAEMAPRGLERLDEPIAVNTEGRRRVDSIQALMSLGTGDPAPDFTLETLDGTKVSLADQRGRFVVMDFWATWCPPCRMSLPKLQEFDTWARGEKLPVTVLAVNTGEDRDPRRPLGRDGRRERTGSFWKGQSFTMTNVMDYTDTTAITYSASALPHLVVIGPDGVILEVERGFNPGMVEHLKKLVRGGGAAPVPH